MPLNWIDDQPNILHQQPCDQRATDNGRTVWVRYDYPGQNWFVIIEPAAPHFGLHDTYPTRSDARRRAEHLLRQST